MTARRRALGSLGLQIASCPTPRAGVVHRNALLRRLDAGVCCRFTPRGISLCPTPPVEAVAHLGAAAIVSGVSGSLSASDPPAKERIKIGQIGVGHAHATKLAVYRDSPNYEVVGVVEPDAGLRKQAENAPAYRGLKWLSRDQLPGDARPAGGSGRDASPICSTTPRPASRRACTSTSTSRPANRCPSSGAFSMLRPGKAVGADGVHVSLQPGGGTAREFLKKGWLGEVFEVHAVMSKVVSPPERKRLAAFPGGMMFEPGLPRPRPRHRRSGPAEGGHLVQPPLIRARRWAPRQHAGGAGLSASDRVDWPSAGSGRLRPPAPCGTEGTFHIQPLDNPGGSSLAVASSATGTGKERRI